MGTRRPIAFAMWLIAAGIALGWCCRPTEACSAPYRSIDWLVSTSPLIVAGRVESVTELPARKYADGTQRGDTPTKAQVRVVRAIKGTCKEAVITILSGPIVACIEDEHLKFTPNEPAIFILTEPPEGNAYQLRYYGTIRPLSQESLVENRLRKTREYQASFLKRAREESPAVYASAQALCATLAALSRTWPDLTRTKVEDMGGDGVPFTSERTERSPAYEAAQAALGALIDAYSAEAIQIALAMEWQNFDPKAWRNREIWFETIYRWSQKHVPEINELQRRFVLRTLTDAGVEREHVDAYVKDLKKNDDVRFLEFPAGGPYPFRERNSQNLTTDFILRCHLFDLGEIHRSFGWGGNFALLDMKRIRDIVPVLAGSDDELVRQVARWAISKVPGTDFSTVVLDELLEGQPLAWKYLESREDQRETDHRLRAIFDRKLGSYDVARLYEMLRIGECFDPACITRAIEDLRKAEEKAKSAKEDDRIQADTMSAAIRDYLNAAKAARERRSPPERTSTDYEKLFGVQPPVEGKDVQTPEAGEK